MNLKHQCNTGISNSNGVAAVLSCYITITVLGILNWGEGQDIQKLQL